MINKIIAIIASIFIMLTGCDKAENCNLNSNKTNSSIEQNDGDYVYQKFLKKFEKENLKKNGVDIESVVEETIENVSEIKEIDYWIERINLSQNDKLYNKDLMVKINVKNNLNEITTVVCLFVFQENESFTNVLTEHHNYANIYTVDILNNSRKQIVLITDDSGNGKSLQLIKILSFNPLSYKMEIVFDEILSGISFLPYKKTKESEFYSISFVNEYEFVSNESGTKGILFTSKIFENEIEILESGSTYFVFNGVKFVPIHYYDYKSIAKEIYDGKI